GVLVEGDQDHRRFQRQRGERADRRAVRLGGDVRGHHGHRGRYRGQRVTENGRVDPVVAGTDRGTVLVACGAAVLHCVLRPASCLSFDLIRCPWDGLGGQGQVV